MKTIFQEVEELTDLDKLYLALAEVSLESHFNTLYFSLGITSLSGLKQYSKDSVKLEEKTMSSGDMENIQDKIAHKHFNFQDLAQVTAIDLSLFFFLNLHIVSTHCSPHMYSSYDTCQ